MAIEVQFVVVVITKELFSVLFDWLPCFQIICNQFLHVKGAFVSF